MRRSQIRGLHLTILVLLFLTGCAIPEIAQSPPRNPPLIKTTKPTITQDPCTGWWCSVTGVVYSGSSDAGNQVEGVTAILHQTSYCSPTSGQHQTTTSFDGRFEFNDVLFHDTDRILINFESKEGESAQWDSIDFNCLYCSCFGSSLEIGLQTTLDP